MLQHWCPNIGPALCHCLHIAALNKAIEMAKKKIRIKLRSSMSWLAGLVPLSQSKKKIKAIGGTLMVNPDGVEWLRAEMGLPVTSVLEVPEQLMVKHAGLLICISKISEAYIQKDYAKYQPQAFTPCLWNRYNSRGILVRRRESRLYGFADKQVSKRITILLLRTFCTWK